jgi:hypothetical protein
MGFFGNMQLCFHHGLHLAITQVLYKNLKPKCLLSSDNDKKETPNIKDASDTKELCNDSFSDLENEENFQDSPNNQDYVFDLEYLAYQRKVDKKYIKNLEIFLKRARRVVKFFRKSDVRNLILQKFGKEN